MSTIVVSIHDVHPSTLEQCRRLLALVEERRMVASLLVVAGPWRGARLADTPEMVEWLRRAAARGHEIALHGWDHTAVAGGRRTRALRARVLARGCAEFADLDREAARERLERGLAVLHAADLHPVGFTPPGWLASQDALDAVFHLGFAYSTHHLGVSDLWHDREIVVPAVCQRPDSPVTALGGELTRRFLVRRVVRGRDVRLALHPADVDDPRLADVTRCLLDVASCVRTTTYAQLVDAAPQRGLDGAA